MLEDGSIRRVLTKSSGLAIFMVLDSVLVSSSYGVSSASIASIPPPPVSGYVWTDSGTTFYSVMYQGQLHSAGVIVGVYVLPDMILDKKYDLYFYVRRDPIIIFRHRRNIRAILSHNHTVKAARTGFQKFSN